MAENYLATDHLVEETHPNSFHKTFILTKDEIIDNLKQKVNEIEKNMKANDDLINDLVLRIKVV